MTNGIVKTRFAPSPTGLIHLGNVRTALFNALFAKAMQGVLLLRIEDTDQERSEESYSDKLMEDLEWLGIEWQEGPYYQSQRHEIYQIYYQQLIDQGLAYLCYCSEQELALSRKVQLASGRPPRYAGTCEHLSKAECVQKEAQGLKPSLRFKVPKTSLSFTDGVQGPKVFQGEDTGDFIIRRSDETASFMFSNAIDDALMGVTHVVRGEDHLTNTPRQLWILSALGLRVPQYAHLPMIVGNDAKPLSKRNGSENVQSLREQGYFPLAILNYLARLGHTYAQTEQQKGMSLEDLALHFKMEHIGHSSAHFDPEQLKFWQKTRLASCEPKALWDWMSDVHAFVPQSKQALFIKTVTPNIVFPQDAEHIAQQLFGQDWDYKSHHALFSKTPGFLSAVAEVIQETQEYPLFIERLKAKTGLSGKNLFMPLRILFTGETAGPELASLLELLGKERILNRIASAQNAQLL